ncbi:hypothetical protein [Nonomuraea sp. NPDC005692]|uniref:hypothetical protein n=1 Tax=Nonomuraea sp. NPDC005692 TaxID=3157168 RepID=UPI0033D65FD3
MIDAVWLGGRAVNAGGSRSGGLVGDRDGVYFEQHVGQGERGHAEERLSGWQVPQMSEKDLQFVLIVVDDVGAELHDVAAAGSLPWFADVCLT